MLVSNNSGHFHGLEKNVKRATTDFPSILFRCFFISILVRALTLVLKIRMADTADSLVLFAGDSHSSFIFPFTNSCDYRVL